MWKSRDPPKATKVHAASLIAFIYCARRGANWVMAHPSLFRLADAAALKHLRRCLCWIQSPAPSSRLSLNVWLEHILPDPPFLSCDFFKSCDHCPIHSSLIFVPLIFQEEGSLKVYLWTKKKTCFPGNVTDNEALWGENVSRWAARECWRSYLHM